MFYILSKSVGGRIHDRYFEGAKRVREEYYKLCTECQQAGWVITKSIDRINREKGIQETEIEGITNTGEKFSVSILEGHFEDLNIENKLRWLVGYHRNLYHTEVVLDAIFSDKISVEQFQSGYKKIEKSEDDDLDEFVPDEFRNL